AFTIFRLARTAGVSLPGKTKYLQQVYTIYNGGSRRAALPLLIFNRLKLLNPSVNPEVAGKGEKWDKDTSA
ncbi:DUF6551 family protein, partial [Phocaeicola sp.]|uniref:DUF6551 family protein n=1 Tax=Phocaeicola sp. TaxID=2773926 RepID=UPI003AB76170